MRPWVTRALVLTLVHASGQTVVVAQRATDPERTSAVAAAVLGLVVGVALLWGAVDGWRRVGTVRTWCVAALVTGPAAGLLALVVQATLVDATGAEAIGATLLGGAFTALLVLLPALAGLAAGRRTTARPHTPA